jgi:hypothetical protein
MKYYQISFPGEHGQDVTETWSEDQIIDSYFRYWATKMIECGRGDQVSREACIEDWKVVHWAGEVDEWGRMTYTDCDCGCNTPVAETPEGMLKFLAHRLDYAGVAEGVAKIYARDIRKLVKEHYGIDL